MSDCEIFLLSDYEEIFVSSSQEDKRKKMDMMDK